MFINGEPHLEVQYTYAEQTTKMFKINNTQYPDTNVIVAWNSKYLHILHLIVFKLNH